MLTAKDVREVQFHKSMGGYKTIEVDDFLDQVAETLDTLTSQNEENKNKMQVLAETIVEYRNQEDSIRFALINAQRRAESVVKEAQEKADALLAEAQEKANALVAEAEESAAHAHEQALKDTEAEQAELARIRKDVSDFKSKLLSIYREHLTLIGVLEDSAPAEKPVAEETAPELVEEAPTAEEIPAEETEPVDVEDDVSAYAGPIPDFSVFELKEDEE